MTATDNATTRLAEIEARVANPNQMNVNQLHAVVQDDVPWLIAELRETRSVLRDLMMTALQNGGDNEDLRSACRRAFGYLDDRTCVDCGGRYSGYREP